MEDAGSVVMRNAVDPTLCDEVREAMAPWARSRKHPNERVQDAWRGSEPVWQLASHPEILGFLTELYGRRPIPFQTLNFAYGTEQPLHADSVHFDSIPHGWMCGVWVALEDVGSSQGPLIVVPGSHRVPSSAFERSQEAESFDMAAYELALEIDLSGLRRQRFLARKGDALIWHADLVHGGARVLDPTSTRWSQVTHYFFEGFTYVTPMHGDRTTGGLRLREPLVDISTGKVVRHQQDGRPARLEHVAKGRSRLLDLDDPARPPLRAVASATRGASRRTRTAVRSWLRLLRVRRPTRTPAPSRPERPQP